MLRRLALAACALTGVPLVAAWLISQRVLHPKAKVEDHDLGDFVLPAEDVSFLSRDGTRLAGWFVPPAGDLPAPRPGIVLSHGHGRSRAELLPHADFLHRAGFAVLAFDYRHRGQSGGGAVTMGLDERGDLQAAVDTLTAQPEVDASRIGVFGMSMGGVVALLLAASDSRIRAVVAEAPYATRDAVMTNALRHFYRVPSFPLAPLAKWLSERRLGESMDVPDAIDVAGALAPRPLFFIADERDAVLGHEEARRLFDAAGEPKRYWLIPSADHARGWQAAPQEYERRVATFFTEALDSQAAPRFMETAATRSDSR